MLVSFVFQDGLLKGSIGLSFLTKNMWKSYNYIWELFFEIRRFIISVYTSKIY